jgi:hypothetical protein
VGLRAQAATDLQAILEGEDSWPITVTDPSGTTAALTCLSTDIGLTIDPETGVAVSGRHAEAAIALATLDAAGLGIPRGIADTSGKPWIVTFDDILGTPHTFKVRSTLPDRALGLVRCVLEHYKQA